MMCVSCLFVLVRVFPFSIKTHTPTYHSFYIDICAPRLRHTEFYRHNNIAVIASQDGSRRGVTLSQSSFRSEKSASGGAIVVFNILFFGYVLMGSTIPAVKSL